MIENFLIWLALNNGKISFESDKYEITIKVDLKIKGKSFRLVSLIDDFTVKNTLSHLLLEIKDRIEREING